MNELRQGHTCLDDIHGVGDDDGASSANGGGDRCLQECGLLVVFQLEDIFFREGIPSEQCKGPGSIT